MAFFACNAAIKEHLLQLVPWSHHTPMGFTLRGYRTEARGKPVLHMLHGNGFCSRMYQPMLRQLYEDYDLFLSVFHKFLLKNHLTFVYNKKLLKNKISSLKPSVFVNPIT